MKPRAELRGVLGSTLPLLHAVASEGVHLHGTLVDRDRLSFLKLAAAELWMWHVSSSGKQTFEMFLGPALETVSGGEQGAPARRAIRLMAQGCGSRTTCRSATSSGPSSRDELG